MRFAYVRFFSFFKRKRLRTARGYTKNASSKHSKPANGGFYTPSAACCPTSRSRPVVGATLSGSSVQRLKLDPNPAGLECPLSGYTTFNPFPTACLSIQRLDLLRRPYLTFPKSLPELFD